MYNNQIKEYTKKYKTMARIFMKGDEDGYTLNGDPYIYATSKRLDGDSGVYKWQCTGTFDSDYIVWKEYEDVCEDDALCLIPAISFNTDNEVCKECVEKVDLSELEFCKRCGAQLTDGKCPYNNCGGG